MRIKRFEADSMKDVLSQVRKELGEDAIILSSKKVTKGGVVDFFGKSRVEVTAAVDHSSGSRLGVSNNGKRVKRKASSNESSIVENRLDDKSSLKNAVGINSLKDELEAVKSAVNEIATSTKYERMPSLPGKLRDVYAQLMETGVEHRTAADLVQELHIDLRNDEFNDSQLVERRLLSQISEKILTSGSLKTKCRRPKVVALVGPTGVGKTTTIAKLAAGDKLFGGKEVALVSQDTYRVAALEQLRTFAIIAGIPMETVYTPDDMRMAIALHKDKQVIFIDTTGRSQRNAIHLAELKNFLEEAGPDEIHLVLSMTTKHVDILDITEKFSSLSFDRVVLTKLDETTQLGNILNITRTVGKPVSYVTFGQEVPEDIAAAVPESLAMMIYTNRVEKKNGERPKTYSGTFDPTKAVQSDPFDVHDEYYAEVVG